jgi:hypothetical protein
MARHAKAMERGFRHNLSPRFLVPFQVAQCLSLIIDNPSSQLEKLAAVHDILLIAI